MRLRLWRSQKDRHPSLAREVALPLSEPAETRSEFRLKSSSYAKRALPRLVPIQ